MSQENPFPLNIPSKVNSPELLAWFQQFDIDRYLSAEEINKIVNGLQFLYENIGGGSLAVSGITTLGTITIDGDEVTFSGFAWKIAGVDYAQAAPITRTLPFASEGMYRTHTAYFTTTNDINIAVGDEDDEVTTEPNIPEGTLRMRAFNVFGEVITVGPGEALPYDINLLDELLQNPQLNDLFLINVGGIDFKIKWQRLLSVLGGDNKPIKKECTLFDLGVETFEEVTEEIITDYLNVLGYDIKGDEIFYLEVIEGTAEPLNRFHYEPGKAPTLSEFQTRIGFTLTNGKIEGDSIIFDNEDYAVPNDAFNLSGLPSSISLKYVKSLALSIGTQSFTTQALRVALFLNATTVADGAFQGNPLELIELPSITELGTDETYDAVFFNVNFMDIALTIPSAMMTNNGGNPHASIQYLIDNNTVTVTTV
jgi:hypothetical protein